MKRFSLPLALIALAIGSPAKADLLSRFESVYRQDSQLNSPEIVAEPESVILDPTHGPNGPSGPYTTHESAAAYPFKSGCSEPQSSCCADLWRGYCGQGHCGGRLLSWFDHCAARCGPGRLRMPFWPPLKGCGSPVNACGSACNSGGPTHAGTWGYGYGSCATCSPCGPHKLGLFDWLPRWRGCESCGKGYGGHQSSCGCGATQGAIHGGYETTHHGETIITPHSVPAPTPVPAPSITPTNSARRLLLPHRIYRTDFGF